MSTSSRHPRRVSSARTSYDDYGTELWNVFMPKPKERVVSPEMAFYCFDVLISKLKDTVPSIAVDIPQTSAPIFVTWTRKGMEENLRGSLGTFTPIPLRAALNQFAISSAINDDRFKPIKGDEVCDLQVTVAVLWDFEPGKNFLDWTIGVHGLQLALAGRGREKMTTKVANLLPEYPIEMGWTKVETIDALMRKAGFIGKINGEDRQGLKITRFQTQKVTQTYDDFNRFRNWKSRHPETKISTIPPSIKTSRF